MGRVVGITLFLEYTLHMIYTLSINIVGDIVQTVKKKYKGLSLGFDFGEKMFDFLST